MEKAVAQGQTSASGHAMVLIARGRYEVARLPSLAPDPLMTEIVALQLFLTNALSPVACGERMSAEQYQELMRNVKTNKHRAAREVVAQYAAENEEEKRHA